MLGNINYVKLKCFFVGFWLLGPFFSEVCC